MRKVLTFAFVVVVALAFVACGGGDTREVGVTFVSSVAGPSPVPVPVPVPPLTWPQPHPDGQYGHEDPSFPPQACNCPTGYAPVYNGWNFVCERGTDREMPRACPVR